MTRARSHGFDPRRRGSIVEMLRKLGLVSMNLSRPLLGLALAGASTVACGGGEPRSEDGGTEGETSSETGDEFFDDAACSVRLSWEPGVGDASSFPTFEMLEEDASAATGFRVAVSPEDFPGLSVYGEYTDQVVNAFGRLDGFGTAAGVFVGFDGVATGNLPAPEATPGAGSQVGFVVMPEGEDAYLIGVEMEWTDEGQTLLAAPLFPLPAGEPVAFFATTSFAAADGDCLGASDGMRALLRDGASAGAPASFDTALSALSELGVIASSEDLAVMQTFPVGTVQRESEAIAQYIAGLPEGDFALSAHDCAAAGSVHRFCTATLSTGNFRDEEGHLDVDPDAVAPTASWDITVYAWLPAEGEGPWPTILYGHGLSGDGEQAERLADISAPEGFAVVSIDAVMHGLHPSLEGQTLSGLSALLAFFAADLTAGNIDALELRDNFRQSTYDKLYVTRALLAGADLDGDGNADVQPDQLAYLGASLGAIMGVELLALTDAYRGGVLVMPGGRLSSVMTDPMGGFDDVLTILIPESFDDGDTRRLFVMLQTVLDAADPSTYGGNVIGQRKSFAPNAPDLLMGAVLDDGTVVNRANWAVARALGLDIVPTVLRPVVGLGQTPMAPFSGNAEGGVTAGMLQFDVLENGSYATHTNMSFSEVGQTAWMAFLTSLFADGDTQIVDPYAELGVDHG